MHAELNSLGCYDARPVPDEEVPVELRLAPLLLPTLPQALRAKAMMLQGRGEFTSDRAITLLLQHAYSGTAEERSRLLSAVKDVSSIGSNDEAETHVERWRRLVSYLPRFGIATPDYGEMVAVAEKLVKRFDAHDRFSLERALYVREHRIHNIGSEDKAKFDGYLDFLVSLIRVVGGKPPSAQGRLGAVSDGLVCKFFANGSGCNRGKSCANRHETDTPGACFTCGQTGHQSKHCSVVQVHGGQKGGKKGQKAEKGAKGKGGKHSDGKAKPSAAAASVEQDVSGEARRKDDKKVGKKAAAAAKRAEVEQSTMQDTLQRLLAKPGRVVVQAARPAVDDGASTLDSGASTMFRHAMPGEDLSKLVEVEVELAMGRSKSVV